MKYLLRQRLAGAHEIVEINFKEYKSIHNSMDNLLELFLIEEEFDLAIDNYYEYEVELLSVAGKIMIYTNDDYYSISRDRRTLCRRLMNLLSTSKSYLDQMGHHLSNIYGSDSKKGDKFVKKEQSLQYDTNFGYKFMTKIRNYSQHQGFPFQSLYLSGKWVEFDDETKSKLEFLVIPKVKYSYLEKNKNVSKDFLNEVALKYGKDELDIRPFLRDYIEDIGKIQDNVRNMMKPDLEKWENIIEDNFNKFTNKLKKTNQLKTLLCIK